MEFSLVYEKHMPWSVKGQHDGVLSSVAFERTICLTKPCSITCARSTLPKHPQPSMNHPAKTPPAVLDHHKLKGRLLVVCAFAVVCLLCSCGQKGPLYMPTDRALAASSTNPPTLQTFQRAKPFFTRMQRS